MNEFRLLMNVLEAQSLELAEQIDDPELTLEQRAFIVGRMSGIQDAREAIRDMAHRKKHTTPNGKTPSRSN